MDDSSRSASSPAIHAACREVVRAQIAKYGWTLCSEDELVNALLSALSPASIPDDLERLVVQRYTVALYEACCQTDDQGRRERAYTDLFRYLYRTAYNRWPDLAKDVSERALDLIYQKIGQCRSPGSFLAFAMWILRQACSDSRRSAARRSDESLEVLEETADQSRFKDSAPPLEAPLLQQEQLQVLLEAIKRLPDERKQQVVLWRFFGGLSDTEISGRLGITEGYIAVLRFNAMQQLRKDQVLKDYFERSAGTKS